jgi:hypothetical protein
MARNPKPTGRKLADKGASMQKRPTQTRELRPRFLIVCEGKQTEPNYFKSFRVNADVEVFGKGRSPQGVVEYAQKLRRKSEYTHVWVVFDRDEFSAEEFNAAIEQAKKQDVGAAYSNEAFELWYVLHFDFCDTAQARQSYQATLTEKLGSPCRKNAVGLYESLRNRQPQAIANAQRLLEIYQPNHNPAVNNPCTTVHLLVMELNQHLV